MTSVDDFEDRVRDGLRAAAGEVRPSGGLATRVRGARRRQVRRRRTGQGLAAAAVVVAVVAGVVALPGGSGTGSVSVAAAAERTAAEAFRFETVLREGNEEVRAEGSVEAGADSAELVTTTPLPDLGQGEDGQVEVVLDSSRLYVSLDGLLEPSARPDGAAWLALDLDGAGYTDRLLRSVVEPLREVDPSRALDLLGTVTEEIVEDGDEEIRGEPTTRYRFTAQLEESPEVDGRAWVDAEGRLRRLELREADVAATLELFDFGADVRVDPPPADDVITLDQVLQEGLEGVFGGGSTG